MTHQFHEYWYSVNNIEFTEETRKEGCPRT